MLALLLPLFSFRILEGGFASAAVLISSGAVLGKLNPFQILIMTLIEAPVFVMNSYLGYTILGVADVGKIKITRYKLEKLADYSELIVGK